MGLNILFSARNTRLDFSFSHNIGAVGPADGYGVESNT